MASDSIIIAIGVAQDTIIIAIHWSFHHVVNQLSYHYKSITHIVTVRVHEQQKGHSSTSCHRRLLTLVQICKSLWPKWEDGGARNKPGKNIFWIYPVFKWNVIYLFKEAPSSADSILLSGRLESTRDQLESTDADSHLRLQLSESSIHTQSGEASIRRRTVFSIITFT